MSHPREPGPGSRHPSCSQANPLSVPVPRGARCGYGTRPIDEPLYHDQLGKGRARAQMTTLRQLEQFSSAPREEGMPA